MDNFSIILIAIALSMDTFTVSIANSLAIKELNFKNILGISFTFGLFQAIMPLIGYFLGIKFENNIKEIDHWIAFILLGLLGIKMIYEGIQNKESEKKIKISLLLLICQAFATTIDAFIVGISLALLNSDILLPALIIGIVTIIASIIGLLCGQCFRRKIGCFAEIIGGIMLFGLGCKILLEHLS